MSEPGEFRPSIEDIEAVRDFFGDPTTDFEGPIIEVDLSLAANLADVSRTEERGEALRGAAEEILAEQTIHILSGLTGRERFVLNRRYGLINVNERQHTLREIGVELGMQERGRPLSKERIRQIESEALLKLRHPHRTPPPSPLD